MATAPSTPSGLGGPQQLATHAADAVGAFALDALCRGGQRRAATAGSATLPTAQQREQPPPKKATEEGHRNKNSRKLFKGE